MPKYLYALLLVALQACHFSTSPSDNQAVAKKSLPVFTVIFIDKSVSVNPNQAFVSKKYTSLFKEIIQQNIHGKGDRLAVYYIHENTAKARVYSLTSKATIAPEDTLNASATDVEMVKNRFDLTLRKEKTTFLKKCNEALAFLNDSGSNQHTDIWASLDVLNKLIQPGEKQVVKVFYLSDMIESMDGAGRRDFHKTPPRNRQQADAWAKEDATQLQQHLEPERLAHLEIKIALPFPPGSTVAQNNPSVTRYWETLFSLLGVEEAIQEI